MGKSLKQIENGGHFKYIHNNMSWIAHYFWKPNTVHQTKAGKKQDQFIFLFIGPKLPITKKWQPIKEF